MCMAIPSRILAIHGNNATVECFGIHRVVSLMLMTEPVELGDYLVIQSGSFAVEKVERRAALEALEYLATVIGPVDAVSEGA